MSLLTTYDRPLAQLVADHLAVSETQIQVTVRPALTFQSNKLYDIWYDPPGAPPRHFIAKEYLKPDEFADAPRREFGALQLLAPLDVAPQPLLHRPVAADRPPIVVYEFMAGAMWNRRRPTAAQLIQLAELWLTVQALPTTDLWLARGAARSVADLTALFQTQLKTYAAWAGRHHPAGADLAAQCLDVLARRAPAAARLAALPPVNAFCRSDARFANIIQRPDGRLGMVDWEDSGRRDPARDVADLLTHANQEDMLTYDQWRPFLETYLPAGAAADPALAERVHLYLGLFPIFWLSILLPPGVNRHAAGQLAGWHINDLPANLRLRRYLARALAWPDMDFDAALAGLGGADFFPEG